MFNVFQELKVFCSCDIYYFVCQLIHLIKGLVWRQVCRGDWELVDSSHYEYLRYSTSDFFLKETNEL